MQKQYTMAKDFVKTHPAYLRSYTHHARFWAYGLAAQLPGIPIEKFIMGLETESVLYSRAATWALLALGGDRVVDEFDKSIKKYSGRNKKQTNKPVTQSIAKGARLSLGVGVLSLPIYYALPDVQNLSEAAVAATLVGGFSFFKTVFFQPAENYFLNSYPSRKRHGSQYMKKVLEFGMVLGASAVVSYSMLGLDSNKLPVIEKIENMCGLEEKLKAISGQEK